MIVREDLIKIGQFKKPHGVKGEIVFTFTNDSFTGDECPFLICELDGIFVPFKIENCRFTSDSSAHLRIKNRNSDNEVRLLANKEAFFPVQYTKEDEISNDFFTWNHFIGFDIIDERLGTIGCIVDIDDSTINTLFIVKSAEKELLIPAVDEIITHINEEQNTLFVDLPEGLTDLQ
jgi:16S rRNA processing protein RimM